MMKSKKKVRHRDAEATKAALLGAARKLFASHGYDGARTQQIADETGINKAMISYYFGGKKGIYQALLIEDLKAAQKRIADADVKEMEPQERLTIFIRTLCGYLSENPFMVRILTREQMSGSRNLEPRVWKQLSGFLQSVRDILQQGIECGSFRKVDAHALHLSMVGGLIYYILTEPARETYSKSGDFPPAPSWNDYVEILRDLYLRALMPESDQSSKRKRRKK